MNYDMNTVNMGNMLSYAPIICVITIKVNLSPIIIIGLYKISLNALNFTAVLV